MSSFDQPMPPYNASDPSASFLSTSCLDFMLIELVPMAYRVANDLVAGDDDNSNGGSQTGGARNHANGGSPAPPEHQQQVMSPPSTSSRRNGPSIADSNTATARSRSGTGHALDEDEERDAVFYRLETLGYRVGLGLVERFSRDRPRFNDTLDAIKFICKDLWTLVFRKQVDNLKTNHRGVYVLTDNAFRPFSRMSTDPGGQAVVRAQPFLWFPCGILRGALAAMGINATVQAETTELPGAVFQIKTVPLKS